MVKKSNKYEVLTFPERSFTSECITTEMMVFSYACNIRLSNFVFDLIVGEIIRKLIMSLMNNLIACSG